MHNLLRLCICYLHFTSIIESYVKFICDMGIKIIANAQFAEESFSLQTHMKLPYMRRLNFNILSFLCCLISAHAETEAGENYVIWV